MLNRKSGAGTNRRAVLKNILGMGAVGVVMPLAAQQHGASPAPDPFYTPPAAPPLLSHPGPFHAATISGVYDVRTFGATGDGKTLDTPAINKAIEAAAAVGGGQVYFPAGTYLCYSIRLKSRIELRLDPGATILAADAPPKGSQGGYDAPEPNPAAGEYEDFGHRHWHDALIWGVGLENVSITGPGLIWGKGLWTHGERGYPGVSDKAIGLKDCRNVTLRDFSILEAGDFGILATGVDNLTIDNLRIDTNRDTVHVDCCWNVRISGCTMNSPWGDLCLKSSFALGFARPTRNVTISDCFLTGGYQLGTLLNGTFEPFPPGAQVPYTGRIAFGTESNGAFQNVVITNCVFDTAQGIALVTVDGALLEDISITNITMRNIVNSPPLFFRLGARMRGPADISVGKLRRVNISNLVVSNAVGSYASILSGIPGYEIEDVKLSNIYVLSEGGGTREDAAIAPPEMVKGYPEPPIFGATMPSYGFYLRHVKGIEMSNVEVAYAKEDLRPAFVLDAVEGADFIHVKAQRAPGVPVFVLNDVRNFNVWLSPSVPETHIEQVMKKSI